MAKSFSITPHKVSICILLHAYSLPSQSASLTYPFSSISDHNRFGLFLFALTKSHDSILEPKLENLLSQLRAFSGSLSRWMTAHLTTRLSSLSSPDHLINMFAEFRVVLGGSDYVAVDDNQVVLDPNSCLGVFLRRCIVTFNLLSFESVCHLLTSIGVYDKDVLSNYEPYDLIHEDDPDNELEALSDDPENDAPEIEVTSGTDAINPKHNSDNLPFHFHAPVALNRFIEDAQMHPSKRYKIEKGDLESPSYVHFSDRGSIGVDSCRNLFVRTHVQVQSYLIEKAQSLEKHGNSTSMQFFDEILTQIKKLAPNLHQVHFLHYLNSLYHDDYLNALRDLHCYFDRSVGSEELGIGTDASGSNNLERYETALLCLGMTHFHFGHPKHALEVLAEAVRFSQQQNDDSCLAYTLAVICNLLAQTGGSSVVGLVGASDSPLINFGRSFSVEQQLFVLLKESLKRAEALKLQHLVASNHLSIANFHLMHVQRPLLSFGPNASMKIKTCPIDVCKELRLCGQLVRVFDSESCLMTNEGDLSTAWLNLSKPIQSILLSHQTAQHKYSEPSSFLTQSIPVPQSVSNFVGSSYILRATAWELYGSSTLAQTNSLIYATCFGDSVSSYDSALIHAKLIQQLAVFKGYQAAFSALKIAEKKILSVSKPVILLVKLQLLHECALHRGHLKLAQRVCDELGVLASPISGVDVKLKAEAGLRYCRTLLAMEQFNQAADVAHSLFFMCYKYNMQVENATILLMMAEIHKKSGNAVMGLPYVLASLSFCQSLNLDLLKASATVTLAELLLLLGPNHAVKSLRLVHETLPLVLGHGGLELCARARLTEAKCRLGDQSFSVLEDAEAVLDPLRLAANEFEILEFHEMAAETFYLMAIIYDSLGQLEEREDASASFQKHILALENPDDFELQI